jgi:tRNA(adenine34) deaminase
MDHKDFMREALKEAGVSAQLGEVPVGAVIVRDNTIIGRGHNLRESLQDPTAHAEILAIREAAEFQNAWRLENSLMYVTIEPCPMCAGAIVLARIPVLVFGAGDPRAGACGSIMNIVQDSRLNHWVEIISGVLEEECSDLIRDFFQQLRKGRD